jgi:hypothetical protein
MGLKTEEVVIGENKYTVTQLGGLDGFKLWHRLARHAAPGIAKLGPAIAGKKFDQLDASALLAPVAEVLEHVSEDELVEITKKLLGSATINGKPLMPQFEIVLAGQVGTIFLLLKFALEVNYGSFLGDLASKAKALADMERAKEPESQSQSG